MPVDAGLDHRGVGGHGELLAHRADLHRDVDDRVGVDLQDDAVLHEGAEPLQVGLELVRSDRQVREGEARPSTPVTALRAMPVSVWVTVTSTPGSAPPLESRTNPVIWAPPTAWADTADGAATISAPITSDIRALTASPLAGRRRRLHDPSSTLACTYSPRR